MNKKFTYLFLIILFFGATAFVVMRYNGKLKNKVNAFYPVKERNQQLAEAPEWASVKQRGADLIRIVRDNPEDVKSTLALATLYIQEARVTGDYNYYDAAAMHYVEAALEKEPENFEALTLKSILQLSQHHFADALETAGKAKQINPYNAYVYGIMVDGHVEMGNYKAAVENSDQMVAIRPDIRSYSRISYLREIHGDYPGAIEAMKMAVDAGAYGDEPTAWARIQLARLYENIGELKNAEMHYTIALDQRPGYAYAIAGMGNIAMANKDYGKAIEQYKKADALVSDYSFREKLAELYLISNQPEKAKQIATVVIKELNDAAEEGEGSINHHADKELAFVYLLVNNQEKALKHALAEYSRRPDNIEVAETVAWSYYKNGDVKKALPYLQTALKTGSKNPTLLCRAGAIYAQAGDHTKAKTMLQDALKANPNIEQALKKESLSLLSRL